MDEEKKLRSTPAYQAAIRKQQFEAEIASASRPLHVLVADIPSPPTIAHIAKEMAAAEVLARLDSAEKKAAHPAELPAEQERERAVTASGPTQQKPLVTKRGRPGLLPIHGEKVLALRGDVSQPMFCRDRACNISVDLLQKAEQGFATKKTITKICKYAGKKGQNLTPEDLKKNRPRKTAEINLGGFRRFLLALRCNHAAGNAANH